MTDTTPLLSIKKKTWWKKLVQMQLNIAIIINILPLECICRGFYYPVLSQY